MSHSIQLKAQTNLILTNLESVSKISIHFIKATYFLILTKKKFALSAYIYRAMTS